MQQKGNAAIIKLVEQKEKLLFTLHLLKNCGGAAQSCGLIPWFFVCAKGRNLIQDVIY